MNTLCHMSKLFLHFYDKKLVLRSMRAFKKAYEFYLGQEKKNVEFPPTRPILFYGPDPTDFIGKFV